MNRKKLLLSLGLLIGTVLSSSAVSGYRGFANIEGGLGVAYDRYFGNIGLSTNHGYQFSDHFFLGVGIGAQYSAGLQEITYDLYHNEYNRYNHLLHISVYAQFRYDYSLVSTHSFYVASGVGYDFVNSFYVAPECGIRFGKIGSISFNIGTKINLGRELWYYNLSEPGSPCIINSDDFRIAPSIVFGIEF